MDVIGITIIPSKAPAGVFKKIYISLMHGTWNI
jgi:hypothetical protein